MSGGLLALRRKEKAVCESLYEALKVSGCLSPGSVMLCVNSWKIWIGKIKMLLLSVCVAVGSVGDPS